MRNENAKVYELAENDIWAGSTSAEYFMRMIGDLIPLLTQRESGQRPMAAKQFAPEEFRKIAHYLEVSSRPHFLPSNHSVRLMIMAAAARFLLGRQGQTFFPSATHIACENPPSCRQLTDSELRFVQARLAGWPKHLQFRLLPGELRCASGLRSVRFLSTILSSS
jgi:hypothetical protein